MSPAFLLEHHRAAFRDPADGSAVAEISERSIRFAGGRQYPIVDGHPVLVDEATSLFSIEDIVSRATTTQDRSYRDPTTLKNFVRRKVLPSLTLDRGRSARLSALNERIGTAPVLVLGAGDRIDDYRRWFPRSEVVSSDVHLQFGADCVIDAHRIPFCDHYFGLVLADQVLEHTSRPWIVAAELERVARQGGTIHIEVPFNFPYHGAPYDFYRFTPSALRFLFSGSRVINLSTTEGRFSSAAVYVSAGVIDSFGNARLRQLALAGTRLTVAWMKYLDLVEQPTAKFTSPKGLFVTVEVDHATRTDREMLHEIEELLARP